MTKTHDKPLTPAELFRRGIEITQEIRGKIVEARAYYLGRSSRESTQPLGKVFNPESGPILPYLVKAIRMLTQPQGTESHPTSNQSTALKEFEQKGDPPNGL